MFDAFIYGFLQFAALQLPDTSGSGLSYCVIERPHNFRMCIPKTNKHFVLTSFVTREAAHCTCKMGFISVKFHTTSTK